MSKQFKSFRSTPQETTPPTFAAQRRLAAGAIVAAALLPFVLMASSAHAAAAISEVAITVAPDAAETIVVQHFGWAEQEFAKVNMRVRYVGGASAQELPARSHADVAERLEKVMSRARTWIARNPEAAGVLVAQHSNAARANSPQIATARQ